MKRTGTLVLAAFALVGCQDMGLEDNVPLREAMEQPPKELVAEVMAPSEVADRQLVVDGRLWVPSGLPLTLQQSEIRPVGASNGQTVYARSWDEEPYDELFVPLGADAPTDPLRFGPVEGDGYLAFAPVIGGGRSDLTAEKPHDQKPDGYGH